MIFLRQLSLGFLLQDFQVVEKAYKVTVEGPEDLSVLFLEQALSFRRRKTLC